MFLFPSLSHVDSLSKYPFFPRQPSSRDNTTYSPFIKRYIRKRVPCGAYTFCKWRLLFEHTTYNSNISWYVHQKLNTAGCSSRSIILYFYSQYTNFTVICSTFLIVDIYILKLERNVCNFILTAIKLCYHWPNNAAKGELTSY